MAGGNCNDQQDENKEGRSFDEIIVTESKALSVIEELKEHSACGPDGIPPQVTSHQRAKKWIDDTIDDAFPDIVGDGDD